MKEIEIRAAQADLVKNTGVFSGTYYITVRHFDGRQIERRSFQDFDFFKSEYRKTQEKYAGFASVRASIEFELDI